MAGRTTTEDDARLSRAASGARRHRLKEEYERQRG